jgi:hypothetical protein
MRTISCALVIFISMMTSLIYKARSFQRTRSFHHPHFQLLSTVTTPPEIKSKRTTPNQFQTASIASAAAVAAAAVNAAVAMKPLSAPDAAKSYVFTDGAASDRLGKVDEVGLPLIYNKELIEAYWKKQGSALSQRWTEFLGYAVPFLTKVVTIIVTSGTEELQARGAELARDARLIFEKLVSFMCFSLFSIPCSLFLTFFRSLFLSRLLGSYLCENGSNDVCTTRCSSCSSIRRIKIFTRFCETI